MDEINNSAQVIGIYNNQILEMETEELTIPLLNDVYIYQSVNKRAWATGILEFTFVISNQPLVPEDNRAVETRQSGSRSFIMTDILDPSLIKLITGSLTINGVPAGYGTYTYDDSSGLLTIFLDDVTLPVIIVFQAEKKGIEVFQLINTGYLNFSGNSIASNTVIVIGMSSLCICKANQINLNEINRDI